MEIFLVYTKKIVNHFYSFSVLENNRKKRIKTNFFPGHLSLILLGSARLLGIQFGVNADCS